MNEFDKALKHIIEGVNESPVDRTMDSSAYRKMDMSRAKELLGKEGSLDTDEAKQILHELWRDKGAVVARAAIEWFKSKNESVNESGYVATYRGSRAEIDADTLYDAKQKAIKELRVPDGKEHLIIITLVKESVDEVKDTTEFSGRSHGTTGEERTDGT